jgi:hypothetical protein|tara:strand:+ start:450 stop:803 length:354 start_codon:yes stop_codon:yes gene_type:complete
VEASLFKEVKEAKEKVQFYTNKIKRIEYALENEVSQIARQQLTRDKESAEVYAEKWILRTEMLFNRRVSSLLNEKHGDYWIKIIENMDWNADEPYMELKRVVIVDEDEKEWAYLVLF